MSSTEFGGRVEKPFVNPSENITSRQGKLSKIGNKVSHLLSRAFQPFSTSEKKEPSLLEGKHVSTNQQLHSKEQSRTEASIASVSGSKPVLDRQVTPISLSIPISPNSLEKENETNPPSIPPRKAGNETSTNTLYATPVNESIQTAVSGSQPTSSTERENPVANYGTPITASLKPLLTTVQGPKYHFRFTNELANDYLQELRPTREKAGPMPLNRYVNVAMKGESEKNASEQTRELMLQYEGQNQVTNLLERCDEAHQLLAGAKAGTVTKPDGEKFTPSEIKELEIIAKHRLIMAELGVIEEMGSCKVSFTEEGKNIEIDDNYIVADVHKRISALEDPKSTNVVHLTNGTSTFSLAGGSGDHYTTFEFQRDSQGKFYFIFHNRGQTADDSELEEKLHGQLVISDDESGKEIAKTSIRIEVPKELMDDAQFLKSLIEAQNQGEGQIDAVYQVIVSHLLENTKGQNGKVIISDEEKKLSKMQDHLENLKSQHFIKETESQALYIKIAKRKFADANDMLNSNIRLGELYNETSELKKRIKQGELDLDRENKVFLLQHPEGFHTRQQFGTCTESNVTAPEKQMAGTTVTKALKLFTIETIVDKVQTSSLSFAERNYVQTHADKRMLELKGKFKKIEPEPKKT